MHGRAQGALDLQPTQSGSAQTGNVQQAAPQTSTATGTFPASSGAPAIPSIQGADPVTRESLPTEAPKPASLGMAGRPSEFQRFVEAATGRRLPVFGSRFFADGRAAVASTAPVSNDHVVGAGDEILIRAWGGVDINYRARVDRSGQISLPKVGTIPLAGVRASDLERRLRSAIGRYYTNFQLTASLGQLQGITVFVVGQAAQAGTYTLSSQSTVLSAVAAAGGPGPNGSMRRVTVRRDGRVVGEFDLYDFLVQGDKSKDVRLASGDSVVFEPAGPRVALSGATDNPAIYELRGTGESLNDLLRYAGGVPVLANPHRIQLERIDPSSPEAPRRIETLQADASGLSAMLRDGDVVTVLALSPKFANAVTLKGHVAQPLRHAFRPGMRIRDLIPDKDALIAPDYYRRKNLLVQVQDLSLEDQAELRRYREQFQLQTPPPAAPASSSASGTNGAPPRPALPRPSREQLLAEDMERAEIAKKQPSELFDEVNWDYAMIERLSAADLSTQILTFSPRKAILEGDSASNLALMPGDVVTIFSQRDLRVPVARQTRIVSVEGEVGAAGLYQLLPGETLRQLVARAGGFTPQAYVYGTEFSREETRRRQKENLESAIQRLEALSATQTARNAANLAGDMSAAAAAQTSQAATEAQLRRLRSLKPNGRIAMELDPNAVTLEHLPDVPLEGGDRIVVPARPGFVTVAGAVANSNAFLWKTGRTAQDYLKLAGVEESADVSQMFILRADGTVMHSADRRGFLGLGSGIGSVTLFPGDALIVPSQLDYETWGRALVRNLKDWSQIFYQFGLGAAAIVTLRNN